MENFNNTLTQLNNLISKLETNTGNEVKAAAVAQNTTSVPQPEGNDNNTEGTKASEKKQAVVVAEKPGKKVEEASEESTKAKDKKKQKKAEKGEQKKQEKAEKVEQKKEDGEATVEDFSAIDIRIGEIVQCWKHPQSEKLYCEKINVCGQIRQIASGLQQFVAQDDMKGLVIVMANLKPRPLAKFMSNGMVVCASNHDHTDVKIIRPQGALGERVVLEGYEKLFTSEAILPVLNPKKKILEKCIEHFRTDAEGNVTWKGIRAKTSGGYLKTQILNGTVS